MKIFREHKSSSQFNFFYGYSGAISTNLQIIKWFGFLVFNSTFSNISVISWQSVLLEEKSEYPEKNHQTDTSHWQTFSHNVVRVHPSWGYLHIYRKVYIKFEIWASAKIELKITTKSMKIFWLNIKISRH